MLCFQNLTMEALPASSQAAMSGLCWRAVSQEVGNSFNAILLNRQAQYIVVSWAKYAAFPRFVPLCRAREALHIPSATTTSSEGGWAWEAHCPPLSSFTVPVETGNPHFTEAVRLYHISSAAPECCQSVCVLVCAPKFPPWAPWTKGFSKPDCAGLSWWHWERLFGAKQKETPSKTDQWAFHPAWNSSWCERCTWI